jgi:hypothetical protein
LVFGIWWLLVAMLMPEAAVRGVCCFGASTSYDEYEAITFFRNIPLPIFHYDDAK